MKRNAAALLLAGVLTGTLAIPALAAEKQSDSVTIAPNSEEELISMPDSVLYYGEILELIKEEDGTLSQLRMNSDRYGEKVFTLSADTLRIDCGEKAAATGELAVGQHLYVFHSPSSTFSLPPQSPAFALVENIPMDMGSAMYHEIEAVTETETTDDGSSIAVTTDNGALTISVSANTTFNTYSGEEAKADGLKAGNHMMVWYTFGEDSGPVRSACHIMLLPEAQQEPLTRAQAAALLHAKAGSPVVNYLMQFSDVTADLPELEAVRWAASEQLMGGYGDGTFGPHDPITLAQFLTVLWRNANSPRLMDFTGLSVYSDADELPDYSTFAFLWACQQGALDYKTDTLGFDASVTMAEAEHLMDVLCK